MLLNSHFSLKYSEIALTHIMSVFLSSKRFVHLYTFIYSSMLEGRIVLILSYADGLLMTDIY